MARRAETILRPAISTGDTVTIAASPEATERAAATVASVDDRVVVVTGHQWAARVGQVLMVDLSDRAALFRCPATVEAVAADRLTVRLSDDIARVQRRDYARVYVEVPLVLLVARPGGRAVVRRGTTVDVSAGGAAIRTTERLAVNTAVPFVLSCDDELQVTGVARVIDSVDDRRGRARLRLHFEQLRVDDRDALGAWVFRRQVPAR